MELITARAAESNSRTSADSIPDDFDPVASPIIATHFYGWRSLGAVAADVVQDLTFRRKVQRLCAKGPRVVGELLGELGAERGLGTVIDQKLDRYLALADEALDATNGREFPSIPLHRVGDG